MCGRLYDLSGAIWSVIHFFHQIKLIEFFLSTFRGYQCDENYRLKNVREDLRREKLCVRKREKRLKLTDTIINGYLINSVIIATVSRVD